MSADFRYVISIKREEKTAIEEEKEKKKTIVENQLESDNSRHYSVYCCVFLMLTAHMFMEISDFLFAGKRERAK